VEVAPSGSAESVREAAARVDGVLRAEAAGELLRVYSDRGGRVISSIIGVVEDAGMSVTNISLTEPSLETLFIELTGRKLD